MAGGGDDDGASGHSSPSVVEVDVIAILTIFGVLFLQFASNQASRMVANRTHAKDVLEMMYKELMILGLVAFALFAIEQWGGGGLDEQDKHVFEDIHMTLFLIAVFYATFVVIVFRLSVQISRKWEQIEELEFTHWKDLKVAYERLAADLGVASLQSSDGLDLGYWFEFRHLWLAVAHPRKWFRYRELAEHVRFHELRMHFIRANHLPRNFHFVTYLKRCKQHVALQLVEIRSSAWLAIAIALSIDLFALGFGTNYRGILASQPGLIAVSAAVTASVVLIYLKTRHIYLFIMHSDFIRYDPSMNAGPLAPTLDQTRLFWFRSPNLTVSLLQLTQFLLAINVAIIVQRADELNNKFFGPAIAMVVVAVASFLLLLPKIILRHTMVTHVGEFVDRQRLSESLRKQQRKFKERALPPSLRQAYAISEFAQREGDLHEKVHRFISHANFVIVSNALVMLQFFLIGIVVSKDDAMDDHHQGATNSSSSGHRERFLWEGGGDDEHVLLDASSAYIRRTLAGNSSATNADDDDGGSGTSTLSVIKSFQVFFQAFFLAEIAAQLFVHGAFPVLFGCMYNNVVGMLDAWITVASSVFLFTSFAHSGQDQEVFQDAAGIIILRLLRFLTFGGGGDGHGHGGGKQQYASMLGHGPGVVGGDGPGPDAGDGSRPQHGGIQVRSHVQYGMVDGADTMTNGDVAGATANGGPEAHAHGTHHELSVLLNTTGSNRELQKRAMQAAHEHQQQRHQQQHMMIQGSMPGADTEDADAAEESDRLIPNGSALGTSPSEPGVSSRSAGSRAGGGAVQRTRRSFQELASDMESFDDQGANVTDGLELARAISAQRLLSEQEAVRVQRALGLPSGSHVDEDEEDVGVASSFISEPSILPTRRNTDDAHLPPGAHQKMARLSAAGTTATAAALAAAGSPRATSSPPQRPASKSAPGATSNTIPLTQEQREAQQVEFVSDERDRDLAADGDDDHDIARQDSNTSSLIDLERADSSSVLSGDKDRRQRSPSSARKRKRDRKRRSKTKLIDSAPEGSVDQAAAAVAQQQLDGEGERPSAHNEDDTPPSALLARDPLAIYVEQSGVVHQPTSDPDPRQQFAGQGGTASQRSSMGSPRLSGKLSIRRLLSRSSIGAAVLGRRATGEPVQLPRPPSTNKLDMLATAAAAGSGGTGGFNVKEVVHEIHYKHQLAQQLWHEAVTENPDIVAVHGMYSVPILRIMLGRPAFDVDAFGRPVAASKKHASARTETGVDDSSESSSSSSASSYTSSDEQGYESGQESDEQQSAPPAQTGRLQRSMTQVMSNDDFFGHPGMGQKHPSAQDLGLGLGYENTSAADAHLRGLRRPEPVGRRSSAEPFTDRLPSSNSLRRTQTEQLQPSSARIAKGTDGGGSTHREFDSIRAAHVQQPQRPQQHHHARDAAGGVQRHRHHQQGGGGVFSDSDVAGPPGSGTAGVQAKPLRRSQTMDSRYGHGHSRSRRGTEGSTGGPHRRSSRRNRHSSHAQTFHHHHHHHGKPNVILTEEEVESPMLPPDLRTPGGATGTAEEPAFGFGGAGGGGRDGPSASGVSGMDSAGESGPVSLTGSAVLESAAHLKGAPLQRMASVEKVMRANRAAARAERRHTVAQEDEAGLSASGVAGDPDATSSGGADPTSGKARNRARTISSGTGSNTEKAGVASLGGPQLMRHRSSAGVAPRTGDAKGDEYTSPTEVDEDEGAGADDAEDILIAEEEVEEIYQHTVVRRGVVHKQVPPMLLDWQEFTLVLTKSELVFFHSDDLGDLIEEDGVLVTPPSEQHSRIRFDTIQSVECTEHHHTMQVSIRSERMTVNVRGVTDTDTVSWHDTIRATMEEEL